MNINITSITTNGRIEISVSDNIGVLDFTNDIEHGLESGIVTQADITDIVPKDLGTFILNNDIAAADELNHAIDELKGIKGSIKCDIENDVKTTITLSLLLSSSTVNGLNILVGKENYIIPMLNLKKILKPGVDEIEKVGNVDKAAGFLLLDGVPIPIIKLSDFFGIKQSMKDGVLMVVESGAQKVALCTDGYSETESFPIQSFEDNYKNIPGCSGAVIQGNGKPALILNIATIISTISQRKGF